MPGACHVRRVSLGVSLAVVCALGAGGAARVSASPSLADAGRSAFAVCAGCHATQPGGHSFGPNLFGVVGRKAGMQPGASPALAHAGITWTPKELDAYITAPAREVPGNRMPFGGIADPAKRKALIAYLSTLK